MAGPVIVGAGVGMGTSVVTQLATTGEVDWNQVVVDGSIGAVMGAFGGSAIGRLGMTLSGGLTGAGGDLASQWISGSEIVWGSVVVSGLTGAFFSFLSGPGAQHGKLYNRAHTLERYSDPNNKARHFKNLNKQLAKYTTRLRDSAMNDIKGGVILDLVTSIIDNLI